MTMLMIIAMMIMMITSLFFVASLFFSAFWLAEEKSSNLSVRFWISRPGLHHDDHDFDDDHHLYDYDDDDENAHSNFSDVSSGIS